MQGINQIHPKHINVSVCKTMMYYWQDSHEVNLIFAKRYPQQKQYFLQQAKKCREHFEQLVTLAKLAMTFSTIKVH